MFAAFKNQVGVVGQNGNSGLGPFAIISLVITLFLLSVVSGNAAVATTPGEYLLAGGNQLINISVSYTDDDNGDNSLLIEWDENGDDWSDLLGSTTLDHAASPYQYAIFGLQNQSSYQVRITLQDGDMADDVRIFTSIKPYNQMIHTSLSTASIKWAGSGGWGIVGGKYGRFACETCHQVGTTNVKRVKAGLVVTDGDSSDQLPIEVDSGAVVLTALESGSADLGDDSRITGTTSSNICEACHTQTDYHRYDTTGQPGGTAHYNKSDCIKCHNHSEGFKAGCGGCHADPPEWNSHPAHLEEGRILTGLECGSCHQTATHLNGSSEISFDPAETRLTGASYSDADQTSRYTEAGGYVATPDYVSCQSVYCHSNGNPFDGTIAYNNPTWGGAAMTCSDCHDDAGDDTTLSSNHPKHVGTLYDFSCAECHATTVSDNSTVSNNTLHINAQKDVSISTGDYTAGTRACDNLYCHSDGNGNPPNRAVAWSDSTATACDDCHAGKPGDTLQMISNGHERLANDGWIRQYPCEYCHSNTTAVDGTIKSGGYHVNAQKDIAFDAKWNISGNPTASYNSDTKVCDNIYCHSDGTTVNPTITDFPWDVGEHAKCDSCHGHKGDCESCHTDPVITGWPAGKEWLNATPMYANTGPGTDRANSHVRHLQTDFSCGNCHFSTVVGACEDCHDGGIPTGSMGETGHVDADYHVNKVKDVVFMDGGTYDPVTKRCSNTVCHTGSDPQWGDSASGAVLCLSCHGSTEGDVDDFDAFNDTRAKIDLLEWADSGHGRQTASGNYSSGNPPANFPGNPCWYCHDNDVLHKDENNPYRLVMHPQFENRFVKECVYCHMEHKDAECLECHNAPEGLSHQLTDITAPTYSVDHSAFTDGQTTCLTSGCHPDDASTHKTDAGVWTAQQKEDVRNQYMMMGVCLQCHDDDSNSRCNSCHTWEGEPEDNPYRLGYDPGTGFIAGSSKASSTHFGHEHWQDYLDHGTWKGGKFCWDCHDPHGDSNIYMVQAKVATETEGLFGKPLARADVVFTKTVSGADYAKSSAPYNGICNVCHQNADHYRNNYGDGHRASRRCTECHEHGFGGGHASGQACNECHQNKPIPNHLGFGLPRDCIKCHDGAINLRMDISRQFNGQSHHVQGVELDNKHCYQCHWEATPEGLIDNDYHAGYNYKTYASVPNAATDLVVYGDGIRPLNYVEGTSADTYEAGDTVVTFTANKIGTAVERTEVTKVSVHCLSCHSDQNNDTEPFGDCKTPRQYAWDRESIDARYSQTGTTTWGKYSGASYADKSVQKAFSAHGNAVANGGGWNTSTGEDGAIPNTRAGSQNVQCFDCHSSHGSYTSGVTSSYPTFDGSYGGANLKETQAGKGGYGATYKAVGKTDGINPMSPAAAQCFDCHENQTAGSMPWGYQSTYGASQSIMGYRDSSRFGAGNNGTQLRYPFKQSRPNFSGHMKAASPLTNAATEGIGGTCTPCHDPHGVSPTLGANQAYAVPLLKGTWLTSPYKEDAPGPASNYQRYNNLYFTPNITQTDQQFAGLCLRCHPKGNLTDGINKNTAFQSLDRVHETVKGWGSNAKHVFSCSKCHQVHVSGLPRLMRTNCLDWPHRGNVASGGATPGYTWPSLDAWELGPCHETQQGGAATVRQKWNTVTPW